MFNSNKRKIEKFFSKILNSKITYFIILIIMLTQFLLISIIFFENKTNKYLIEQTNFKTIALESQQKQLNEKINSLQTHIMRMSTQIYRLQQTDNR